MSAGRGPELTDDTGVADEERSQILALAHAAASTDGTAPLDDQVHLDLALGTAGPIRHIIARWPEDGGAAGSRGTGCGDEDDSGHGADGAGGHGMSDRDPVVGYAHLDLRSPQAPIAHAVVTPTARRRGVGRALITRLGVLAPPHRLHVWAHGDGGAAAALAAGCGMRRVRELRQMRLSVNHPIAQPAYPSDVVVRPFVAGHDEDGWVEVNHAAFREHPEQGRVTVADLLQREQQPWFDPAGFFVAERDGAMVGFHWTKVHTDASGTPEVGEVHMVGVHPAAQGSGLGSALTLTGLQYLRARGLDVILYVESDNATAIAVYNRIGFEVTRVDVVYAAP